MKKARETRLSQLDVQRKSAWLILADKTLAVFPCHVLSRALRKFVKIRSFFSDCGTKFGRKVAKHAKNCNGIAIRFT